MNIKNVSDTYKVLFDQCCDIRRFRKMAENQNNNSVIIYEYA